MARPISCTTSTSGRSESQTHLLTMNLMAESSCARYLGPHRPGIEYLWNGTEASFYCQMWLGFSSLTATARYSCPNLLLPVSKTVFNTELVTPGLWTFSPSPSCLRTALVQLPVVYSSAMILFSCSDCSWGDELRPQHS